MDNHSGMVVRHPDFEETKRTAVLLNLDALKLQHNCPDCVILKEKYDAVFNSYRKDIEELDEKRRVILTDLKKILETKRYYEWTQADWQKYELQIEGWRIEQKRFDAHQGTYNRSERARERNRLWKKLLAIIHEDNAMSKDFDESQLEEVKELERRLDALGPILKQLSKSTHKWKPIEWSKLTTRTSRIRGAEGSLEAPRHRKAEEDEIVKRLRCNRCQKEVDAQNAM